MRCIKACSKVLLGGSSVDRGSRNNSRNSSSRCLCNHHRQLFLYCGEPTMMEATNSSRKFWRCSIPAMAAKGNIQEVRQRHVRVKRRIYERCHLPTHDIKDVIQETNTLDETKKAKPHHPEEPTKDSFGRGQQGLRPITKETRLIQTRPPRIKAGNVQTRLTKVKPMSCPNVALGRVDQGSHYHQSTPI